MEDVNIMRILDINNRATYSFVFRLILSWENGG
jgi:hypothetical protein